MKGGKKGRQSDSRIRLQIICYETEAYNSNTPSEIGGVQLPVLTKVLGLDPKYHSDGNILSNSITIGCEVLPELAI